MVDYPPDHVTSADMWEYFTTFPPNSEPFGYDCHSLPSMVATQQLETGPRFPPPWTSPDQFPWTTAVRRYYSAVEQNPNIHHTALFHVEIPLTCGEVALASLRQRFQKRSLTKW